jgi:Holliday junction resolvasome RuvABC endonuclease subunit
MPGKKPRALIMGLDVSSKSTGYCVIKNGRWYKGKSSFGKIELPDKASLPEKLVIFRDSLRKLLTSVSPTLVVIEDVFSGRNVSTMKNLARYNGVAIELCRRYTKSDPRIVLASTVRAFFGCGRSKEEAFNFIKEKYKLNWEFKKMNDVTDAVLLALFGHQSMTGSSHA